MNPDRTRLQQNDVIDNTLACATQNTISVLPDMFEIGNIRLLRFHMPLQRPSEICNFLKIAVYFYSLFNFTFTLSCNFHSFSLALELPPLMKVSLLLIILLLIILLLIILLLIIMLITTMATIIIMLILIGLRPNQNCIIYMT